MRKWTAVADVRRGAALPPVRYSDAGTALPAAIPTVTVPLYRYQGASDELAARLGANARRGWSVSYLVLG